jgi:hypothetical protein
MTIAKTIIHVACGTLVSLPFFAPLPFYYTLTFGVFRPWLVIDGEEWIPGDFMCGPFKLHFYPGVFVVCITLWIVLLVLASRWLRYLESKSYLA